MRPVKLGSKVVITDPEDPTFRLHALVIEGPEVRDGYDMYRILSQHPDEWFPREWIHLPDS